ncbi:MAG: signal peptidase II [Thermomicrobiales bacterium]
MTHEDDHHHAEGRGSRSRWWLAWVIAAIVLVLDQVTKAVIVDWLGRSASTHRWELVGRWGALEYVENTGAAFGILAGQPVLLSALAIVVTFAFLVMMRDEAGHNMLLLAAVGCVVGGSLGNLLDRMRLGYVVDYIAVGIWPKFNVADSAIFVGLALMAWTALFGVRQEIDASVTSQTVQHEGNGGQSNG